MNGRNDINLTLIFNDLGGKIPRSKNFLPALPGESGKKKFNALFFCVFGILSFFLRKCTMDDSKPKCFCCNKKQTKNNPLVNDFRRMVCQPCHKEIISERRYYASAPWHGNPIKE